MSGIPACLQRSFCPPLLRCRDLSSPFVCELEGLFEEHVPTYSRHDKQRCIEQWGSRLEDGALGCWEGLGERDSAFGGASWGSSDSRAHRLLAQGLSHGS